MESSTRNGDVMQDMNLAEDQIKVLEENFLKEMSSAMESSTRNGDVMQDMNLAEDQIKVLEENFLKVSKQPDEATLMLIAAECGLSEDDTAHANTDNELPYIRKFSRLNAAAKRRA
ncbi:UNVERIFIED_CONTAM: hypothetical protein FKN15_038730 [Acipenser sinensis]